MNEEQFTEKDSWPFDQTAQDYDLEFTNSTLGRLYRNAVWQRLSEIFNGKRHILELGCGTGEDAQYLASKGHRVTALDASEQMISRAKNKLESAGLAEQVFFKVIDLEDLIKTDTPLQVNGNAPFIQYDGLLANFGVLNCVQDLAALSRTLHSYLRPGAPAIFVIMGPLVPWEWFWYLRKGQPAKGFRRLSKNGVEWRGITIRYPGISSAADSFKPFFHIKRVSALGTFLPPSYAEKWAVAHPGWISRLERLERRLAYMKLVAHFADHYILEMEHL